MLKQPGVAGCCFHDTTRSIASRLRENCAQLAWVFSGPTMVVATNAGHRLALMERAGTRSIDDFKMEAAFFSLYDRRVPSERPPPEGGCQCHGMQRLLGLSCRCRRRRRKFHGGRDKDTGCDRGRPFSFKFFISKLYKIELVRLESGS